MNIWYGSRENVWLSNLYGRAFIYDGAPSETDSGTPIPRGYYSVEHAYQSLKSGSFDKSLYHMPAWVRSGTKIMGRRGTKTDGNWNLDLMYRLIYQSFWDNPKDSERLCNTTDTFYHHQDKGVWREAFPKLLMQVRADLQKGEFICSE